MASNPKQIYLATRKRNDQLFNAYFMRPLAAVLIALIQNTAATPNRLTLASVSIFTISAGLFMGLPDGTGLVAAIVALELSYLCDCADGMLARHRKIASQQGHLFDFFTDEVKAVMLVGAVGVRLWRVGGYGYDGVWQPAEPRFLLASVAGVFVVASAISLTNFVRRPEISGRETPVEAHYESVTEGKKSGLAWLAQQVMTMLRFLNHYPSHIWIFALAGRLDLFFWMYVSLNALYLARGWLGLVVRFGRS